MTIITYQSTDTDTKDLKVSTNDTTAAFLEDKLTDANGVTFTTNNDGGNENISLTIDHDLLTNFSSNEHIDHSTVLINTGSGLSGGGDITTSRTLVVDINSLTADATPDGAADYLMSYDTSATGLKKVLIDDLPLGGNVTIISDTAPTQREDTTALVAGDNWWQGSTGNKFIYYNDGDTTQWVQTNRVSSLSNDTNVTIVSATAPTLRPNGSSLIQGDMWLKSDNNHRYVWFTDTDSSQWIQLESGINVNNLDTLPYVPDSYLSGSRFITSSIPNSFTEAKNFTQTTLSGAANTPWDLAANQVAELILGGNWTLDNPTNQVAGGTYLLIIRQDGTGSRTLSYGTAYKFPGGTAPTLSTAANSVDVISCVSDGTNMYCTSALDMS